jgi:hypothetical protein
MNKHSQELIELAWDLLQTGLNTTEGQYRKSISASYYAVFHLMTQDGVALLFCDTTMSTNYFKLASRGIVHRSAYNKLKDVKNFNKTISRP